MIERKGQMTQPEITRVEISLVVYIENVNTDEGLPVDQTKALADEWIAKNDPKGGWLFDYIHWVTHNTAEVVYER